MRTAEIERTTSETEVRLKLNVDGSGEHDIRTGLPFFDHMLTQLGLHGLFDLELETSGDLEVGPHHSVEDSALALGQAFDRALEGREGLVRTGSARVPMDEALASVVVDFSGRPYTVLNLNWAETQIEGLPASLLAHFCESFASAGRLTLHADIPYGRNGHHQAEALFKALGRALDAATQIDPRRQDQVPSSKGTLT